MFLLEVFSNDNNGSSTSNSRANNSNSSNINNNNNSKSTGDSNQPKLERFCPRCVGKGFVDDNDIKRLGKERTWSPGVCGFCKGTGYVERTDKRDPRLSIGVDSKW
jgi:DnaJ-class molecular chaperone